MSRASRALAATLLLSLAAAALLPSRTTLADEVETIEDVDVVAVPAAAPYPEDTGLLGVFGRLHPALVHLPVAWVLLAFLLDLATFVLGRTEYSRFGLLTLGLALASAVPAVASGLVRGEVLEAQAPLRPLVEDHEAVMFVVVGVVAVAFAFRLLRRDRMTGWTRWAYLGLMGAAALLIAYGGHLGGRIVFGPDHLPF